MHGERISEGELGVVLAWLRTPLPNSEGIRRPYVHEVIRIRVHQYLAEDAKQLELVLGEREPGGRPILGPSLYLHLSREGIRQIPKPQPQDVRIAD